MQYKDYDIEIPTWLASWQDASWRNDAAAHSVLELGSGVQVEIWVGDPVPELRDIPERFGVLVSLEGSSDDSKGPALYFGDDENEARAWAKAAECVQRFLAHSYEDIQPILHDKVGQILTRYNELLVGLQVQ